MRRWMKISLACAAFVAALALDTAITWKLAVHVPEKAIGASADVQAQDPLAQFQLEREQLRARQEAQLNDIIYSEKTDTETASLAQRQLLSLMRRAGQEATLEGILRSRGFEDAVVSVGERSANVLLRREAVTQRESAVILDLVMHETGLTGGNVKIIPVK